MDDLVRCCSDIRYFTERPRNLPLPIGLEGKLFNMFLLCIDRIPTGDVQKDYTRVLDLRYTRHFILVLFDKPPTL